MQKYLNSMLKQKLGAYLDGLENTQMSFGVREASISLTNVQFRGDALDKFLLPIDIKFGTIKHLNIKVPLLNIQSSPVAVQLQGMDLILAPKSQDVWQFSDIFSEDYLQKKLFQVVTKVLNDIASEQEQGWRDKLKIKILDNFTMNIKDVHVRFEDISETRGSQQRNQIGQTTFGFLLSELDLKTVDANGNVIFHDRAVTGDKIMKILRMEGLAIYLNPQDTLIIHQIAAEHPEPDVQISSMQALMDQVVAPYRRQVQLDRDQASSQPTSSQQEEEKERLSDRDCEQPNDAVEDQDFLTYILKPMNLDLVYEHETASHNKSMKVSIKLDDLQLALQHQQLKAILKLFKTIQTYKKLALMQEKLRKFRQFRPIDQVEASGSGDEMEFGNGGLRPGFDAKAWWKFAITSIVKSFQFKRGAIKAFSMRKELERQSEAVFKEHVTRLYQSDMDDKKRELYLQRLAPAEAKLFWHVVSMLTADELLEWSKQVVTPMELAKYRKTEKDPSKDKVSRLTSMRNWIFGKKEDDQETSAAAAASQIDQVAEESEEGGEDEFDEFFDCLDTEESVYLPEEEKKEYGVDNDLEGSSYIEGVENQTRDRTSFNLFFNIKELSLTLGKLSTSNKIEGIQVYNKAVSFVMRSPTLNIDKQFVTQTKIVEWGLNLVTVNRKSNMLEECISVIQTNKLLQREDSSQIPPQWDMTLKKHDTTTGLSDLELDLNLQIGQIVFKYNEDLVIRAKAISRLKVDQSLQTEAYDQLEELRENTQSAIHSLIYRRRNRYNISIGSPIFLLPINGTFEGKFSPIWAVRTGTLNIATVEPTEENQGSGNLFENLTLDRRRSTPKSRFNFAKVVRNLMRGTSMPKSHGRDTEQYFDHFRLTVSQMGMSYHQSYSIYEMHARGIKAIPSGFNQKNNNSNANSANPPRFAHFPTEQQEAIERDYEENGGHVQNLQKFDVLDEFEINIQVKLKKSADKVAIETEREKEKFRNLPKVSLRIDTSSINIRLSHSIYNNLFNLKHIFTISKEKAAEYNKELTQFNVQIKQQLQQNALKEGYVMRKVFIDEHKTAYERNYCLLSGNHLYFYQEQDSLLYLDYYYLKQTELILDSMPAFPSADPTSSGKAYEVVLQRVGAQAQTAAEQQVTRRSTFKKRGRVDAFNFDTFEAGTARKLSFESPSERQAWIDKIREVCTEMLLDWSPNDNLTASNRREPIIEQPSPGFGGSQTTRDRKRMALNGPSNDQRGLIALKSFQRNQMHGNFNENVDTKLTSDASETGSSRFEDSRFVEDIEELTAVKFELDVSIPSFEVELMKLKLIPGIKQVANPACFEKWVTFAMIGMSFWLEQRNFDQYVKVQINKLSLVDETMCINNRLMTQIKSTNRKTIHTQEEKRLLGVIKHKLGTNNDFDEPALLVEKSGFKKLSPRFEGIYGETHVKMANININFMPGTYNNIIKMLRATKRQTKPVDDEFLANEEYESNALSAARASESDEAEAHQSFTAQNAQQDQSFTNLEKNDPAGQTSLNDSTIMTGLVHRNRRYSIDPEQAMVARATDLNENRNYDFDCLQEKEKPMLVTLSIKKISIGMLHPKYQMELFRLQTSSMDVRYEVFYDHNEMSVAFTRTTLYDLTGCPYSINPKEFYKFVKREPSLRKSPQGKVLENPREMFYFDGLEMKVYQIQSKNCPHKEVGFSSKLEMRLNTMRINYIQESMLRFNDYFMEQLMDCFFMSDPYKDPKSAFDELRAQSQVEISQISQDTDFKFADEIGKMDIEINSVEMKVKDRPHSKDYLLFEIPLIRCDRTKGTMSKLIRSKPGLTFQAESIWTRCSDVNFWFGRESDTRDLAVKDSRLSLLKQPFQMTIEYKKLSGSEVISKISALAMDKAGRVNLVFTPIELIWPQSIYTYMLRCADLNFSYTDGFLEEYFFIKWYSMDEHYMKEVKIVSKHFEIKIPALSMTLQNSDGSFLAEMIWTEFLQEQKNYTDTDKEINISCRQFYILDKPSAKATGASNDRQNFNSQISAASVPRFGQTIKDKDKKKGTKRSLKQAVVCPMSSPMFVSGSKIIKEASCGADKSESEFSPKNLSIFTRMAPGGDKTNSIDIVGLKIFVKFQTFILLQSFFMNAFPSYKMDSIDKPNGFNEDPERQNTMVVQFNIKSSLICFLNKPGQDSICCQGDITIDMVQESISRAKAKYQQSIENLQFQPRRFSREGLFNDQFGNEFEAAESIGEALSQGNSTNDSSDKMAQEEEAVAQINRIYFQKLTVKEFTAFICQLEQLDGSQSFDKVKKRQMMNPVDITLETKYNLKHEEQEEIFTESASVNLNQQRAYSYQDVQNFKSQVPQNGVGVDDLDDDYDDDDDVMQQNASSQLLVPSSAPFRSSSAVGNQNHHHSEHGVIQLSGSERSGSESSARRIDPQRWIWGVTVEQYAIIKDTKVRISIQDVHLLFQIVAFASDSITDESVNKLKEIHDNIQEREQLFVKNRGKTEALRANQSKPLLDGQTDETNTSKYVNYRSYSEVKSQRRPFGTGRNSKGITQEDNGQVVGIPEEDEDEQTEAFDYKGTKQFQGGQEMFDGLIERLENNFDKSMTSQMQRLRASTVAFRKIANGYTQKKYLERESFIEFLDKDVLSTDQKNDDDSDEFQSADEADITDDDDHGEENRRRTIMRIQQRALRRIDPEFNQQQKSLPSDAVPSSGNNSIQTSEDCPQKPIGNVLHSHEFPFVREDGMGMQSDVRDEQSMEQPVRKMFDDGQGPSSRKKSSLASSSIRNQTLGSGSDHFKSGLEQTGRFSQQQHESDESRRSQMKESVQDALSEFFYSCSGSQMRNKSSFRRDRNSKHSKRRTPKKSAFGQPEKSYHRFSERGSDDEEHPEGEIEDDESSKLVQQQMFAPYADVRGYRNHNQKLVPYSSTFHIARSPQEQIQNPSINGSIQGEEASKQFFQHNTTMLAQSKREDLRSVYKHCMDNITKTESEMFCKTLQFVFINDFNQAFTPVAEIDIKGLDVKQEVVKEDDKTIQSLEIIDGMRAQYFNLELGEWEPMIENFYLNVDIIETLTLKAINVNFGEGQSVVVNVTSACLRNFAYTRDAWNAMPEFSKPIAAQDGTLAQQQSSPKETIFKQQMTPDSNSSYSINSSADDDKDRMQMQMVTTTTSPANGGKTSPFVFGPIAEEESKYIRDGSISDLGNGLGANGYLTQSRGLSSHLPNENESDPVDEEVEDNSELEQITPFQIKNQTTQRLMVIQGGIADQSRPTMMGDAMRFGSEAPGSPGPIRTSVTSGAKSTNAFSKQKIFNIASGKHSNYSVSFAQIVSQQERRLKERERAQAVARQQSSHLRQNQRQLDEEEGGFVLMPNHDQMVDNQMIAESIENSDQESSQESANMITFKNAVLVGIRLNDLDQIKSIDLNEISHQDPYVFNLSSTYNIVEGERDFENLESRQYTTQSQGMNSYFDANSQGQGFDYREDSAAASVTITAEKQPKMKASQLLERVRNDSLGLYYNYIFYGVVLDKMQKQLILRTPYVFHNKTLLTLEIMIKKCVQTGEAPDIEDLLSPSSLLRSQNAEPVRNTSERVRFELMPGEKFPLDQVFYYDFAIQMRVNDQNTDEILDESCPEEGLSSQQSIIRAPSYQNVGASSKSGLKGNADLKQLGNNLGQEPDKTTANRGRFTGRRFSRPVSIQQLVNLDLNQGPGEFISGPESDSLCVSIKRQPGELFGTTDLVFLPTISVKNALPCNMKIKRQKRLAGQHELEQRMLNTPEEKTEYSVQKSEQKDFYTFDGCGENGNEISLQIQVDGFLLSDEIRLNHRTVKDQDLEIVDHSNNRLTIGMRIQPFKAGYQVTFFAHTCVLLETVRLLNNNCVRVFYEAETIKQQIQQIGGRQRRSILAGQDDLGKNRFVMSNKDQQLCVSVKEPGKDKYQGHHNGQAPVQEEEKASQIQLRQDYFGQASMDLASSGRSNMGGTSNGQTDNDTQPDYGTSSKDVYFSHGVDIKQAGQLTHFSVKTEQAELIPSTQRKFVTQHRKYDFAVSTSLVMADPEDFIFTKMVVVSPKYVLVNQMKTAIEVAQVYNEAEGRSVMEVGDRKEWYWQDYTKDCLICVRKMGHADQTLASYLSSSDYSDSDDDMDRDLDSDDEKPVVKRYRADSYDDDQIVEEGKRPDNGHITETNGLTTEGNETNLETTLGHEESKEWLSRSQRKKSKSRRSKLLKSARQQKLNTTGRTKQSRKIRRKRLNDSQWTEADKVVQWEWSKGFSPETENQQMSLAIMIREADTSPITNSKLQQELKTIQVKVIRVTKKLLNNTIFVIFEDESDLFPMYRMINECRNVTIELQQWNMDEPKSSADKIEHNQNMIFGFYEPECERKIQLDLVIDRNDQAGRIAYQQKQSEVQIQIVDLANSSSYWDRHIYYQDVSGQEHDIVLSVTNDGQTKTVRLAPFDEQYDEKLNADGRFGTTMDQFRLSHIDQALLQKQEDENERKKLKKQEPNTIIQLNMHQLMVSFVAKVQVPRTEEILIEQNRELLLLTWSDIKFESDYKSKEKKHKVNFTIGHFQIDNQSETNPLFQQIFRMKNYTGARNNRDEDRGGSSKFLTMQVDYRMAGENQEVTFVDRFYCHMAESVLSIDSDFIVNFAWGMSRVQPLFENRMDRVHPLFMKNSLCEVRDADVEHINKDDTLCLVMDRSMDKYSSHSASKEKLSRQGRQKSTQPLYTNSHNLFIKEDQHDLEQPLLLMHSQKQNRTQSLEPEDIMALTKARQDQLRSGIQQQRQQRELLTNVMGEILVEDKLCVYTVETAPTQWRLWHQQDVKNSKETLFLKEFHIDTINMDLSFVVKASDGTSSSADREHIGALAYLKMSGLSLINLDEARFRLPRFGLSNFFIGKEDMMQYTQNFYSEQLLSEIRKLVGSVGIFASPRQLFYSIGDGFHDFVSMPTDGYTESGILGGSYGMAAGTISLTKQIGVGSLQSFQQFCRDAGQLVLLATQDKDYMRTRADRMIIEKPSNFVDGFGYGANSLIMSLKAGIGGLVTRPVIEARRKGFRGFGLGVWQGLSGTFIKPLSGALDLASKSAEGCKNTIGRFDVNENTQRMRMPRTFYGYQKMIKHYNANDALLVGEVLTQIGEGRFKDNNYLEMKLIRPTRQNAHFLMLTEEQLFFVEANQKELVWYIKTELLHDVKEVENGIIISLVEEYEGQDSFTLSIDPISSKEIATWLNAIATEFR